MLANTAGIPFGDLDALHQKLRTNLNFSPAIGRRPLFMA
jgi:hypothetical protein